MLRVGPGGEWFLNELESVLMHRNGVTSAPPTPPPTNNINQPNFFCKLKQKSPERSLFDVDLNLGLLQLGFDDRGALV